MSKKYVIMIIIIKIWRGAIANLNFAEQMDEWGEVELRGKRSVQASTRALPRSERVPGAI